MPGVCGGLAKGCIDWLLNRSVWHLILGTGMMAKGSLVPGTLAQEGEEETGIQGSWGFKDYARSTACKTPPLP